MRTVLVLAALCTSAAAASSSSSTNTTHCPPLPFTRVQHFKSSDIVISSVKELGLSHEADASQYVVVEGLSIGGPMILDGEDLSLVYSGEEYRSTSSLAVKELGGVRYLTFNNGGKRIVLDEQYQERDDLQLDDNETHHAADLLTEMDTGIANCEGWERMRTYKLSKFHWQGRPTWPPHMFVQMPPSGHLADPPSVRLSWNGATEVQSWAILASHNATKVNYYKNVVAVATHTGFETNIVLNETTPRYIGAAAIGADGEVLGSTYVMDLKTGQPVMLSSGITRITAPFRAPSVAAGAMGGTIFGVSMLFYAFNYLKKRKENAAEVVEETPRYSKVRFAV